MTWSDAPLSRAQLSDAQLSKAELSKAELSKAERFADLVDGPQLSQRPAAGEAADHLALVSALRSLDFDVRPSELTRIRQRQRLVAMAAVRPTTVAESAEAGRHRARHAAAHSVQAADPAGLLTRLRRFTAHRRLVAGLAGLGVIVAALGVLALFAQSAIPGDTLYTLKRGTEQARLALAGSEQEEGRVLLGLASTRMEEIVLLLAEPAQVSLSGSGVQAAAADTAAIADLLIATMETMDRQTTDGTSALTTAAVDAADLPTLQFIGQWGVDQFSTLDRMGERMPQDAQPRADESKDLLQRVVQRLENLARYISCTCQEVSASDDLGPLPCPICAESEGSGSPSAARTTSGSGGASTSSSPGASATAPLPPDPSTRQPRPPGTSTAPEPVPEPAPGPAPGPEPSRQPRPSAEPSLSPVPFPIPVPPPLPPAPSAPENPPAPPAPPPESGGSNEGDPCVLIGFLGIEIPGIIIGGVCVGLGG